MELQVFVWDDLDTFTRHFGKLRMSLSEIHFIPAPDTLTTFGTTSILVPDTSASSVRAQYRYPTLWDARYILNACTRRFGKVRYDLDTRTAHLGNFGIPTKNTLGAGIPYRTHPWRS